MWKWHFTILHQCIGFQFSIKIHQKSLKRWIFSWAPSKPTSTALGLQAVGRPLEPHGWRCNRCSFAHTLLWKLEQWPGGKSWKKIQQDQETWEIWSKQKCQIPYYNGMKFFDHSELTPRSENSKLKWDSFLCSWKLELSQLCFWDVGDQFAWSTWISQHPVFGSNVKWSSNKIQNNITSPCMHNESTNQN